MLINFAARVLLLLVLLNVMLAAQQPSSTNNDRSSETVPQLSTPSAAQANDSLAHMRDDLNKLESLNLNMSSEIEFLHDQNLQILLRTNSQMWTILIRDMQRQLQEEEQRRPAASSPPR